MFNHNYDPYDELVEAKIDIMKLQQDFKLLVTAHNQMAHQLEVLTKQHHDVIKINKQLFHEIHELKSTR